MSSVSSLMNVASGGMAAQTGALDVVSQNVANANTAGYTQRIAQRETQPTNGGVKFAGTARSYGRFWTARLVTETGNQGAATARSNTLADTQTILAPGSGLSIADSASAFYSSMMALAQNPSDSATRTAALSAATQLANKISGTAGQLGAQRADLLTRAQGAAADINQQLTTIAGFNKQIAETLALGNDTSSLQDQRDTAIQRVGQQIDVTAVPDPSGSVTLLSSGTSLVQGNKAFTVTIGLDTRGALAIKVQHRGGVPGDITEAVSSGTLGGIREARDVDIPKVTSQLDQYAYDLETNVNALHTAGVGPDGQTGRPLFTPPAAVAGAAYAMAIDPSVAGNPDRLAASPDSASLPGNSVPICIAALAGQAQGTAPSPAQAFAGIVATLGTAKASADTDVKLRTSTVAQAKNLRDTGSGVTLDEEMVNLTRYQRAFQASVRVLQTADDLLSGLITSGVAPGAARVA